MTSADVALILGGGGGILCALAFAREVALHLSSRRRMRAYEQHLPFSVNEDLGNEVAKEVAARISAVTAELRETAPELRFGVTISALAGRLVIQAARPGSGERWVVKTVLDDKRLTRARVSLFNEALVLGHLAGERAPRLVTAAVTAFDRPYVVREMLPGLSLDRVLFDLARRGQPPTFSEVQSLLQRVADAVAHIHSRRVIHGDLKPANILAEWDLDDALRPTIITGSGVFLLDFEAATIMEAGDTGSLGDITRGTPYFMAPERYAQARVSVGADVYSLSALASLLLTGRPERPGSTAGERIPSPHLRNAIRRGMSVDPRGRHVSVHAWIEDLILGFDRLAVPASQRVLWPRDASDIAQELTEEALSITVGSFGVGRSFGAVADRVDIPTLDEAIRSSVSELDEETRRLVDLVWFRLLDVDVAAKEMALDPEYAKARLAAFADRLETEVRDVALARERRRVQAMR